VKRLGTRFEGCLTLAPNGTTDGHGRPDRTLTVTRDLNPSIEEEEPLNAGRFGNATLARTVTPQPIGFPRRKCGTEQGIKALPLVRKN
jgi:hypothetical protein